MRSKKLGNSDLNLTVIGLGTWAIGGSWQFGWGHQNDTDSFEAIKEALDVGINWFDTAPIYGCGHSEEVIGYNLHKLGVKALIATKCGLVWDDERRKINCLRPKSIKKECENSLKRLRIEAIDLYQMHWPIPEEEIEEAWGTMSELVREGKVRYLGASNFNLEQLKKVSSIYPAAATQPPYNMVRREIEGDFMDYCQENDIGILAYSPMQMGLLSGKFSLERFAQLPVDDVRKGHAYFKQPVLEATLDMVEKLRPAANGLRISVAELAIAWVLRKTEVTSAIVGARKSGQIFETAKAADVVLPLETETYITETLMELEEKIA